MPELPEVETVRRGLEPVLVGEVLVRIEQRRANLRFPFPERFVERLSGQTVTALNRRAKYLLAQLSGGEVLVMHLGMSGRFTIGVPLADGANCGTGTAGTFVHDTGNDPKHDHVVFTTAAGATVTYNDPRRFGFMQLIHQSELTAHPLFMELGPEPLGNQLDAIYLARIAQGRKRDLKAFLMDQRSVAGLGNIYVCEALHRSRLSPDRATATLASRTGKPLQRAEHLVAAIRSVLAEAIAAGGSTLRDYKQTDGALGYFQHAFAAYGRQGEPCRTPSCPGRIRRSVHAGRSTFYCPKCQR